MQERAAAAAATQQAAAFKALREELRRDNKRQEDALERQARPALTCVCEILG